MSWLETRPSVYLLLSLGLSGPSRQVPCGSIADTARIDLVGQFSDMRYTEEHAYGHIIELWRAGECVFGLLEVSEGLAGDTPTGELTDVRYDAGTEALSFTAKLTTGVTQPKGSKTWVPSRDLFRFTGRLKGKTLRGKLQRSDGLRAELKPIEETVVLRRAAEKETPAIAADRYGEWRKTADSMLRFRGPKW